MELSLVLILSVTLTSLLQPTVQIVLEWDFGEERNFQLTANSFIERAIEPHTFESTTTTVAVKCAGRRNAPYGFTIKLLEMGKCSCVGSWCPPRCRDRQASKTVECQYAARLDRFSLKKENFLGLICYDKRVNVLDKGMSMDDICNKWRYPGSDVPQLQIPDYLKSVHAYVLGYIPPQIEKRGLSASFFDKSWPKNENERTGFGGVGSLGQLGPNYVVYLVITGQDGFELKLVTEESTEPVAMPQFISEDKNIGEPFIKKSAKKVRDEMGDCSDGELDEIIRNKRVLHGGYLKDRLNTDNAWMQGFIIHLHDPYGRCFGWASHGWRRQNGMYRWVTVPHRIGGIDNLLSRIVSKFVANYK